MSAKSGGVKWNEFGFRKLVRTLRLLKETGHEGNTCAALEELKRLKTKKKNNPETKN